MQKVVIIPFDESLSSFFGHSCAGFMHIIASANKWGKKTSLDN